MASWTAAPTNAGKPNWLRGTAATPANSTDQGALTIATNRGWETQLAGANEGLREVIVCLRGLLGSAATTSVPCFASTILDPKYSTLRSTTITKGSAFTYNIRGGLVAQRALTLTLTNALNAGAGSTSVAIPASSFWLSSTINTSIVDGEGRATTAASNIASGTLSAAAGLSGSIQNQSIGGPWKVVSRLADGTNNIDQTNTFYVTYATTGPSVVVANAVADQPLATAGNFTSSGTTSLVIPTNVFTGFDTGAAGFALTWSATQFDGSALPANLTFTPGTRTFTRSGGAVAPGTYLIAVRATDTTGVASATNGLLCNNIFPIIVT